MLMLFKFDVILCMYRKEGEFSIRKQIAKAYCSIAELYLTDLWYVLSILLYIGALFPFRYT